MTIGEWIRRGIPDVDDDEGQWHLVESEISGAAITKCGRRLEPEVDGVPLEHSEVKPLTRLIGQPQLCKAGCD